MNIRSHFINGVFREPKLTNWELEKVVERFKKLEYRKGDFLLREGQHNHSYSFLEQGFIRFYAVNPEGKEVTTSFVTPGQIIWEPASLFLQTPSLENIHVLEDSVVWSVSIEAFHVLFNEVVGFRENGRTRLTRLFLHHKMRSLGMITKTAENRYLELLSKEPYIAKHAPLKYIASYLGLTDTSLSRIRNKLAKS